MTKSDQKPAKSSKNNIDADDEKCHFLSQLMLKKAEKSDQIADLIEALRKIGYFRTFQTKDNCTFSSDFSTKLKERRLRNRNKARYRKVKKYYKSVKKYKTERIRRKLCWMLSGILTYEQIASFLHVSKKTVQRDINKIRPYYERMFRSYAYRLQAEQWAKVQDKMANMSPVQKFAYLTKLMVEERERSHFRKYRSHYTTYMFDLTTTDKYGIPKLSVLKKGTTLAFPHKISVKFIGRYEDQTFLATVLETTLTQTSGW